MVLMAVGSVSGGIPVCVKGVKKDIRLVVNRMSVIVL